MKKIAVKKRNVLPRSAADKIAGQWKVEGGFICTPGLDIGISADFVKTGMAGVIVQKHNDEIAALQQKVGELLAAAKKAAADLRTAIAKMKGNQ
jgi:hypothetical protein